MSDPLIRSHRLRRSPFMSAYLPPGASVGVYNRRMYPWSIGDDVQEMYWHLRRAVMLYDVPETPLEISGPEACTFLNYLFTRDISGLRIGRASYAIACDPSGGILMDGVLMRLDEDRYWYVMADGPFESWMRAHAMQFDVSIRDPDSWVLQVQGPRALDVLAAIVDGAPPSPFNYFGVARCTIQQQPIIVSRTGWTGEMGFEIYITPDVDGPALWHFILERGAPHELRFGGLDSMGIRRIEAGIYDNGTDLTPDLTPYAAGLGKFVHLNKENFIGRESLSNADRTVRLRGFTCRDAAPLRGDSIVGSRGAVGVVTSAAWSPALDCGIGFAKFHEAAGLAAPLAVRSQGAEHSSELVNLPFFDADKLLPRGIAAGPHEARSP